jgi:1-hydroxycarotenoid 3,4-desaturase
MTTEQPVIVIGAGIGGLAAALMLAARSVPVLVLERAEAPGGKLRPVVAGGTRIDAGPTVFTMRWVFDGIFAAAGEQTERVLNLAPLSILARHWWSEDEGLDLHADLHESAHAIGQLSGAREAQNYLRFMAEARHIYHTLEHAFLAAPKSTPFSLVRRASLADLWRINPFQTLWSALEKQLADPRLRQLFGRYATYCGSSPFDAPATLMLIAHVEQQGVWSVEGGMSALAQAFAEVAMRKGATFRYGAQVERIEIRSGRVAGVVLAGGEVIESAAVVFNGDVAALADGLLGNAVRNAVARTAPADRSLSAVTWAGHGNADGRALSRHNVFFSADYAAEFRDILGNRRVAEDPTVYVCAQDRPGHRPETASARERFLCLVNAPADGDRSEMSPADIERAAAAMTRRLRRCGVALAIDPEACEVKTPADFNRLYPGTGGALYGRALRGWKTTFQREGAAAAIAGLYLAGGSVHPGPGVPMAAISGRLAAEAVMAGLASMRRSHRAAIAGGISTR